MTLNCKINNKTILQKLISLSLFILFLTIILSIKFSTTNNILLIDSDVKYLQNNWLLTDIKAKDQSIVSLPKAPTYHNEKTFSLSKNLDGIYFGNTDTLCLKLGFSNVKVYLDNKLIYSYFNKDYETFSNKAKDTYHMITLPSDFRGKKLKIELQMLQNPSLSYKIQSPIIGSKLSIFFNLIRKQSVLICILFFISTFALFVVILLSMKRIKNKEKLTHLFLISIFSLLSSMYSLSETNMIELLLPNTYLLNILTFMPFLLLPIPILMIIYKNIQIEYKKFLLYLVYIVLTNFYVQSLLNFLCILDFTRMLPLSQIIIAFAILSLLYITIRTWRYKTTEAKYFIFSILPLLIITFIDFILYYFDITYVYVAFFETGLLLFVIIQLIEIMKYFFKLYGQSIQVATYKKMAYTDMMTSIGNRASFENELAYLNSNIEEFSSVWCFVMDLNNLKKVNDKLGHEYGDKLLINFSIILRDICNNNSSCFRTGGDEFILIIKNISKKDVENIIIDLYYKMEELNRNTSNQLSVAIGYDNFKFGLDENMNQLVSRTDKLMYENKQLTKNIDEASNIFF